ncbi:MAG: hypothetical protein JNJ93_09210 [Acinetobacter sp.]|nr:hypothetical protein [Acinetobacter sp.]
MNRILITATLLIGFSSALYAYTPNLSLLASTNNAKYYIDKNSIKTVSKNIKQSVIYEKFKTPVTTDGYEPYKSNIKYHNFNCKERSIAVYKGNYYSGQTSNSEFIGYFNNASYIDGYTGEGRVDKSILEYYTLSELKKDYPYTRITPAFVQAFNVTCKN